MFNSLTRNRVLWILLLSGVTLVVYYLLVFRPLSNTVAALDRPLTNVWQQLLTTNAETRTVEGIDLEGSSDSLRKVQAARRVLGRQREEILSRISLEPALQAKLHQPFQLIDFLHERQLRVEEITRLAKQHSVTLDTNVVPAYPRFAADEEESVALWTELVVFHHAIATAIHSKVSAIKNVRLLPTQAHPSLGSNDAGLLESRITIEFVAPMQSATQFLLALPLKSDELKKFGLPEGLASKPPLFIDKWMLRKASAEKPNEVQVEAVISGFSFSKIQETNSAAAVSIPSLLRSVLAERGRLPGAEYLFSVAQTFLSAVSPTFLSAERWLVRLRFKLTAKQARKPAIQQTRMSALRTLNIQAGGHSSS